ncbi:MAG TPA: DNA double-strand break repair nuclease NurA [Candidatus Binatia bacterium]|nr:DNA double-strand break repair nuclease NurA [Candidatus Binatia bacterium]
MTLELEKLSEPIQRMAEGAAKRREHENVLLDALMQKLWENRTAWERIEKAVDTAVNTLDMKWYRAARPLNHEEPLDAAIDAPTPPAVATLVACDGSQIVPNRHAAFLYSVINVGIIVYHHGQGQAPLQDTVPVLDYPGNGEEEEAFVDKAAIISLRRDLAEIETLVSSAEPYCTADAPVLALLDQRLLYWPVGSSGDDEGQRVLYGWQKAMDRAVQSDCMLAGYIDRPGKRSILTFLRTLDINRAGFDSNVLLKPDYGPGFTDVLLLRRVLQKPGQRSAVFVDVSMHNDAFRSRNPDNEVCFFYLNAGRSGRQIARVDIPRWVADDPQNVAAVHALVYDQCQIMGNYPYVLARADEMAVIGYQDRENLDIMIENAMARHEVHSAITAKQSSKEVARAGRTRHTV